MMRKTLQTIRQNLRSTTSFCLIQGMLLLPVLVSTWTYAASENDRNSLPPLNEFPRMVPPQYDYPLVVSDEQLSEVLKKLHPKFIEQPTKVNFVDHGIRMWGLDATFADDSLSGQEMLNRLINHQSFAEVWKDAPPLLEPTAAGVSVATQQGRSSVSHVDHLMGTLAEIGVPLSHPVRTFRGDTSVRAVLENALLNFHLNQREYEWTALATAFYAQSGSGWYSDEGQHVDFNALSRRLMRQPQPLGVCYGMHRLYSLTILLRIDDQIRSTGAGPLLDHSTRDEVMAYLGNMTQRLYQNQATEGYWDGNWADISKSVPDPTTDELSRRILATGHALEWWAMAPQELHPPRATLVSAGQWLTREITSMDPHKVEKNFTFLTHAGRALALWRATLPSQFEREHRDAATLTQAAETARRGMKQQIQ